MNSKPRGVEAPALSGVEGFDTAYEEHVRRPFQTLFKNDPRFALANQIDYLLLRAEQEKRLHASPAARIGLIDGGLDLDFHGFTRLFHSRGLLTEAEFDLCRRLYLFLRAALPRPGLFVHLYADEATIARRLSARERINIAKTEDTALFNLLVDEWLATIPTEQILRLDVSNESLDYQRSVETILSLP